MTPAAKEVNYFLCKTIARLANHPFGKNNSYVLGVNPKLGTMFAQMHIFNDADHTNHFLFI